MSGITVLFTTHRWTQTCRAADFFLATTRFETQGEASTGSMMPVSKQLLLLGKDTITESQWDSTQWLYEGFNGRGDERLNAVNVNAAQSNAN